MQPAVTFDSVSKRYRLGSGHTSLREALGAAAVRLLRRAPTENGSRWVWALRDVSFQVAPGEALGLIGPNGAGKTTALKILAGITQPTSGRVALQGRVAALIELAAGFHPDLTGRENIYLNGAILGLTRQEINRSFDRIVEFSGLERFIDTPIKRYSSGMYVRLGFSVAAHVEPDVLLVDEVLAVGDAQFRQKCARRIRELRASGTTIVFVAHNLYLVKSICDRALFFVGGRVQAAGDVVEVVDAYESWLQENQIQRIHPVGGRAAREVNLGAALGEEQTVSLGGVQLLDAEGNPRTEFRHDEEAVIEVAYEAGEAVEQGNLVVIITRADGTACCMIRTADYGFDLGTLQGRGRVRLCLSPIQLAGGVYSVDARLMGPVDGVPLAMGSSSWFRVKGPTLGHRQETGVFVPNVRQVIVEPASLVGLPDQVPQGGS